jgi:hypothetical protein
MNASPDDGAEGTALDDPDVPDVFDGTDPGAAFGPGGAEPDPDPGSV